MSFEACFAGHIQQCLASEMLSIAYDLCKWSFEKLKMERHIGSQPFVVDRNITDLKGYFSGSFFIKGR